MRVGSRLTALLARISLVGLLTEIPLFPKPCKEQSRTAYRFRLMAPRAAPRQDDCEHYV